MTFLNKKGNVIFAMIIFIVMLFAAGIMYILSYSSFSWIQGDITSDLTLNESKEIVSDVNARYPAWADGAIALIFVGLWIAGIVSVLAIEEHPIIFGMMMFLLLFVILAGMWLGNSYEEFFQDSDFSSFTASFPMTNWILTHMLMVGIIVGASILLTMMAKNRA